MLKALLITFGVICVVATLAVLGGTAFVAWCLRQRDERDQRGSLDWRLVPDPHGDVPYIPPDYRRELHQDPQKAWPETGEPRGA